MNDEKLSAWRFEVIFSWRTYQIIFYPNYLLDVFSSQNIMSLQSNNLVVSLWSLSNAGKSWWCYLALPGGSELSIVDQYFEMNYKSHGINSH